MIDLNRKDFYFDCDAELKERTKSRLARMSDAGMSEVGIAEFGVEGIVSGLFIEMVWGYSDEAFDDYMKWAIELIGTKKTGTI